jgi:hypothetical protein
MGIEDDAPPGFFESYTLHCHGHQGSGLTCNYKLRGRDRSLPTIALCEGGSPRSMDAGDGVPPEFVASYTLHRHGHQEP